MELGDFIYSDKVQGQKHNPENSPGQTSSEAQKSFYQKYVQSGVLKFQIG